MTLQLGSLFIKWYMYISWIYIIATKMNNCKPNWTYVSLVGWRLFYFNNGGFNYFVHQHNKRKNLRKDFVPESKNKIIIKNNLRLYIFLVWVTNTNTQICKKKNKNIYILKNVSVQEQNDPRYHYRYINIYVTSRI